MWYVYIIQCKDETLYTGITTDVERRLQEHIVGEGARYTRAHKAEKVLYQETLSSRSEACCREIEIKRLNKKQKVALITKVK